jgi:hypothetical protein
MALRKTDFSVVYIAESQNGQKKYAYYFRLILM